MWYADNQQKTQFEKTQFVYATASKSNPLHKSNKNTKYVLTIYLLAVTYICLDNREKLLKS